MNRPRYFRPAYNEQREDLREVLIALLLTIVFVAVTALFLWILGKAAVGLTLAKGYGVFWGLLLASVVLLAFIEQLTGFNLDDHFWPVVGVNLAVSVALVTGWAAFAALTLNAATADTSVFTASCLYVMGFLSCYLTFAVTTSCYKGSIYKAVTLPLSLVAFIVFALWPSLGRMLFGWFFALY